ncbi:MerR family transcriptional regulator [Candidatus Omnitrophota bacterium]
MSENLVNAKDLAKLLGISLAGVNYYTSLGLLKFKDKKGNMRLYDNNEALRTFDVIRRMKMEGYSLRLIQQKLTKGYNV